VSNLRITLIKYISKEIWAIFLTCMLVFIVIIMATRMLDMTDLMINYGAGFGDLFSLILCLVPEVILFAMPVACLMAVLLSFIRMASDNEIIALQSSGISLYQLMPPVVVFSIICFLFTGFLTLFWTPHGNRSFESVLLNIMKTRVESQIKEGVFLELGDFVLYVNSYSPKDKIMKDVFVVDKRKGKERTIVAKKAQFVPAENKIFIQLLDYKVFAKGKEGESIVAESQLPLNYPVEMDSMLKTSDNDKIGPGEMYPEELLEIIKNSNEDMKQKYIAKLKLYEMFSLPIAVLILSITGAPLGARIRAHGRTKGIIISLILFLGYYISLMSVRYLSENGKIDPAIGTWLPVLFLSIICVFFLIRSAGNLTFNIFARSGQVKTPQKA